MKRTHPDSRPSPHDVIPNQIVDRDRRVDFRNVFIGVNAQGLVDQDFFKGACLNDPAAVVLTEGVTPAAVLISQAERICRGWSVPSKTVPLPREIYSRLYFIGQGITMPLVDIVRNCNVCLSLEFEQVCDKYLLVPYVNAFGIDPAEIVMFKGDRNDSLWFQYQSFLRTQRAAVRRDGSCVLSFGQYVEYCKTPEQRVQEIGFESFLVGIK